MTEFFLYRDPAAASYPLLFDPVTDCAGSEVSQSVTLNSLCSLNVLPTGVQLNIIYIRQITTAVASVSWPADCELLHWCSFQKSSKAEAAETEALKPSQSDCLLTVHVTRGQNTDTLFDLQQDKYVWAQSFILCVIKVGGLWHVFDFTFHWFLRNQRWTAVKPVEEFLCDELWSCFQRTASFMKLRHLRVCVGELSHMT